MKKVFKRLILFGGMAAVGYQGFRLWQQVRIANKVEKELPDYLEQTYGEKPKVSVSITANAVIQTHVKVTFSPELLAAKPELEEELNQYLHATYPRLFKGRTRLMVVDNTMKKSDILKKYYPKIYAKFGAMIQKKEQEKAAHEVPEEPGD